MDFIGEEQIRRNRDSRGGWELYGEHRAKISFLLTQNVPSNNARLCVLGAGNSNDLDLTLLRSKFTEIHLVDLDGEALLAGCQAQGLAQDPGIIRHGGIDVSGIASLISSWRPEKPVTNESVEVVERSALEPHSWSSELGLFDVVASTGLLSQLIDQTSLTLGIQHPRFVGLITSVRLRHLRLMLELLKPGGVSWLFAEVVSSQTCPELLQVSDADLDRLLSRCINRGNFFTGCNPVVLGQIYNRDPELRANVANVQTTRPWLWKFIYRTYAVCAFGAVKKTATPSLGPTSIPAVNELD